MITRLMRGIRAGESRLAWNHPCVRPAPDTIVVSSVFAEQSQIPRLHAGPGLGDNVSPRLSWTGAPTNAAELVLIVEDTDAPLPVPFVHCVATGIGAETSDIAESRLSRPDTAPFTLGKNSLGRHAYFGPMRIPCHGPHRYVFQLFALDQASGLTGSATKKRALQAIQGHVIARGRLTGIYGH
jgi:Raf kinase inhibitor-like YbhB/YbcL family protein